MFIKLFLLIMCVVLLFSLFCCSFSDMREDKLITVRLAAPQSNFIQDFDTNLYKLWLEEQTGFVLEMTWLPQEDAEHIVSQQLASGEGMPDAYVGFGQHGIFRNYNLQKYGEMGVIISLNELIEKYGVFTKALFDELPEYNIRSLMTSADGYIYFMPGFSSSPITRYRQTMWVNQGWLNTLGLAVPTTTDDFRDMLRAFRDDDPNGNGITDEIPMAGTEFFYSKQAYDFLINAFIYNDNRNHRLLVENGVVGYAPVRDEWREALMFIHELYDEGLYSPLSFTQDDRQMNQMANDRRDILGAFMSPGITLTVQQDSPSVMERYVGIGPLIGPSGVQLATFYAPMPRPFGVITSASEYPVEVFQLFDLMISEEASLMGRYGEQGVDWDFAGDGDISIYGTPATISIINQIWNTMQNKHLSQIVPYVSRPKFSGGVTWSGSTTDGEYLNAQAALLSRGLEPDEFIRELIYTPEEDAGITAVRAGLETHVRKTAISFITGERDIYDDTEWRSYLQEFDDLGLFDFLAAAQTAFDRMG
jgi:putative aldouronate transport system substrate-binding protein